MEKKDAARWDGGWTMLELMVVVLILGILVGIAVATYHISVSRSQLVTCQSDQRVLNTAVGVYEQDHGALPPDLAALAPYVKGADFDVCPADPSVPYSYDTSSGRITCPLHPAQ